MIADEAKAASQQASYEQSVTHVQTREGDFRIHQSQHPAGSRECRATERRFGQNKALVATGVISAQEYDDSSKSTLAAIANLVRRPRSRTPPLPMRLRPASRFNPRKRSGILPGPLSGRLQAALAQAQLQLSYTKVFAPVTGRVTQRSLNNGNYVQAGQQVMALVPTSVWITANFKETQLRHMRPGQATEIRVDAYPGEILQGHVNSIQPAAARASAFFRRKTQPGIS